MPVLAAYPDAGYVQRGLAAGEDWRGAEQAFGRPLMQITGCMSWGVGEEVSPGRAPQVGRGPLRCSSGQRSAIPRGTAPETTTRESSADHQHIDVPIVLHMGFPLLRVTSTARHAP
jgi:hypothetical protein